MKLNEYYLKESLDEEITRVFTQEERDRIYRDFAYFKIGEKNDTMEWIVSLKERMEAEEDAFALLPENSPLREIYEEMSALFFNSYGMLLDTGRVRWYYSCVLTAKNLEEMHAFLESNMIKEGRRRKEMGE